MIQAAPARVGQKLDDVDTPALILDMEVFEKNLATLKDSVGDAVRIRPHAKTHKCPEVAKRQIVLGAVGMCCQKVSEAEAMVEGGVADVLLTNEIVGAPKLARLAALSRRAHIGVCVDSHENVLQLEASGAKLDAYVEIEVGMRRCGIAPGAPAVELAKRIAASKNLRFAGLQAYHGRAQHIRGMEERHAAIEISAQHVFHTKTLLEKASIPCPIVTGAGSGTFMLEVEAGAWDEIQPGSYAFMDADYAKERMGCAAAALRARALRADDRNEPSWRCSRDRRRRPQGLQRRFRDAGRVAKAGAALHARLGRARLDRRATDAGAGREAAARSRPLRPHDQPLRLVCLRPGRACGSALADHRERSAHLMKKQYLNPKDLSTPRFYTHAVSAENAQKTVYVSGQVSWDAGGNVVGKGDMRAQSEQVFKNLGAALKAAGAGWGDVVKMNGYMVGLSAERVNAYREVRTRFLKEGALPASTLVGVQALVHADLLLEVEVVAVV